MKSRWWIPGLAALSLAAVSPALAWDNQGHMATGAIAYDVLMRENPKVVAEIVALMARHPDRARFARALAAAPAADRDRLLFEYMARWPDDVSGTPADRPEWHHAVQVVAPISTVFPWVFGHAEKALAAQAALAANRQAPGADRAVALCWVFHIVGDMQQPLHAATWVNLTFWRSDRAGTLAYVRTAAGARPMTLHDFWDEAGSLALPDEAGADILAILGEDALARRQVSALSPPRAAFRVWAAEDRELARGVAYGHGVFRASPRIADAPVLAPVYVARARALAQHRIALGGFRLAGLLKAQLDPPPPPKPRPPLNTAGTSPSAPSAPRRAS